MRLTKKRNGKNVIPLLNAVCGIDMPYWKISRADDLHSYLSGDAADKLAAYEDAEEQGLLVRLPCKVGDTVYVLERFCDGSKGDCDSWFECKECKDYQQEVSKRRIGTLSQAVSIIEMLGKTVFLTREEAEAALKGGRDDET